MYYNNIWVYSCISMCRMNLYVLHIKINYVQSVVEPKIYNVLKEEGCLWTRGRLVSHVSYMRGNFQEKLIRKCFELICFTQFVCVIFLFMNEVNLKHFLNISPE